MDGRLGSEWALLNNWSLKGEWLHLDVGNINYTDVCMNLAPGRGGPGPGPKGAWFTNVRLNEDSGSGQATSSGDSLRRWGCIASSQALWRLSD